MTPSTLYLLLNLISEQFEFLLSVVGSLSLDLGLLLNPVVEFIEFIRTSDLDLLIAVLGFEIVLIRWFTWLSSCCFSLWKLVAFLRLSLAFESFLERTI